MGKLGRPIGGSTDPVRSSTQLALSILVASLDAMSVDHLRLQWRNHLGGAAPAHLPRWLLLRLLAYRIQAQAFGDLDKETRRAIRAVGSDRTAPFAKRAASTREGLDLKPGSLLTREWQGQLERVMALDEGFAWNGRTFGSLSQVAKAITGTSWNGHRFFGLKQGGRPQAKRGLTARAEPARETIAIEGGGAASAHGRKTPTGSPRRAESDSQPAANSDSASGAWT